MTYLLKPIYQTYLKDRHFMGQTLAFYLFFSKVNICGQYPVNTTGERFKAKFTEKQEVLMGKKKCRGGGFRFALES